MQSAIAVFLIVLGLGQLSSTYWQLYGASLVGSGRWRGYGLGLALFIAGVYLLPRSPYILLWTPLAGLLAVLCLLLAGSFVLPPPHPNSFFEAEHPGHGGCWRVQIPDGHHFVPGFLLKPLAGTAGVDNGAAVCLVHGAGDTKISFKWRLIQALLAEGLTVLTIDLPGHGENRQQPLRYPDCLSAIPAAVAFLRARPEIRRVGLLGISLGGAISIRVVAAARQAEQPAPVEAVAVVATPIQLTYNHSLFYREAWSTISRSPLLTLLRETTIKQLRESWYSGGYRSPHNTTELFELLEPLGQISQLKNLPVLLVYSQNDLIAPPDQALKMRQAAPQADFIEAKKASHVALTLIPEINMQIARWLKKQLS
jgi:pimeloyl-ACP methyl ester carboxylesterase